MHRKQNQMNSQRFQTCRLNFTQLLIIMQEYYRLFNIPCPIKRNSLIQVRIIPRPPGKLLRPKKHDHQLIPLHHPLLNLRTSSRVKPTRSRIIKLIFQSLSILKQRPVQFKIQRLIPFTRAVNHLRILGHILLFKPCFQVRISHVITVSDFIIVKVDKTRFVVILLVSGGKVFYGLYEHLLHVQAFIVLIVEEVDVVVAELSLIQAERLHFIRDKVWVVFRGAHERNYHECKYLEYH